MQEIRPKLGKKGRKVRFKWTCEVGDCGHSHRWKWAAYEWVEGTCPMLCDACGIETVVELLPIRED